MRTGREEAETKGEEGDEGEDGGRAPDRKDAFVAVRRLPVGVLCWVSCYSPSGGRGPGAARRLPAIGRLGSDGADHAGDVADEGLDPRERRRRDLTVFDRCGVGVENWTR